MYSRIVISFGMSVGGKTRNTGHYEVPFFATDPKLSFHLLPLHVVSWKRKGSEWVRLLPTMVHPDQVDAILGHRF